MVNVAKCGGLWLQLTLCDHIPCNNLHFYCFSLPAKVLIQLSVFGSCKVEIEFIVQRNIGVLIKAWFYSEDRLNKNSSLGFYPVTSKSALFILREGKSYGEKSKGISNDQSSRICCERAKSSCGYSFAIDNEDLIDRILPLDFWKSESWNYFGLCFNFSFPLLGLNRCD